MKNIVNIISIAIKSTSVDGTDNTLKRAIGMGARKRRTKIRVRRTKT